MNSSGLKNRSVVFGGIVVMIAFVFIARLAHLQLISSKWSNYAGRLTEERETLEPMRGQFLDRHGNLVVSNIASYDLMITPRKAIELDTTALGVLLGLDFKELKKRLDKAAAYSRYVPSIIVKQLNAREFAMISKQLMYFPGIKSRTRSVRSNVAGVAGHLLGEYREVDRDDIRGDVFYQLGDYKGKSGLEASFEKIVKRNSWC